VEVDKGVEVDQDPHEEEYQELKIYYQKKNINIEVLSYLAAIALEREILKLLNILTLMSNREKVA